MAMTDPIAAMLTKIRNAIAAEKETVQTPASKIKVEIAKILHEEGFIRSYTIIEKKPQNMIDIELKYGPKGEPVLSHLRRISRPSLRRYSAAKDTPQAVGAHGICILSTSKGLLTGRKALRENVGGEILCEVW